MDDREAQRLDAEILRLRERVHEIANAAAPLGLVHEQDERLRTIEQTAVELDAQVGELGRGQGVLVTQVFGLGARVDSIERSAAERRGATAVWAGIGAIAGSLVVAAAGALLRWALGG